MDAEAMTVTDKEVALLLHEIASQSSVERKASDYEASIGGWVIDRMTIGSELFESRSKQTM